MGTAKELEQKVGELEKEAVERKQVEEALRESEKRFRFLVEVTSDWIWEVDRDGVYTYASPKAEDMLGYKPEQIVGKTPFDFMPVDEAERVAGLFRDIVQSGKTFSRLENTNIRKDGRHVVLETSGVPVLDAYGNVLGYRGIDRDITECKRSAELNKINKELQLEIENRKRAEEKTKFAYAELNQIFNTTTTGICLIDKNFNVLKVNQCFLILSGINMNEAKGKKCYETFPYDLCNTPNCILTRILGGEERIEVEVEKKRIDGTAITCILTAIPFRGYSGNLIGVVEHLTNITMLKKFENELQDTLKELRKALRGTIQAMALTVETRDPYTAGHQRRVTDLARTIAKEMGLPRDKITGIRMAGVLHDIGKIAIPSEILSKPGRLNGAEFDLIKNHPQVSYDILKSIKFP